MLETLRDFSLLYRFHDLFEHVTKLIGVRRDDSLAEIGLLPRRRDKGVLVQFQQAGELLLVEDDPAYREALREVLAHDGYHCHGVATALEARRVIEAVKADGRTLNIALIDVRLPDESGLSLARELSAEPGVRCLLMSGWETDAEADDTKTSPPLLLKPFSPDVLLRALAELRGGRS